MDEDTAPLNNPNISGLSNPVNPVLPKDLENKLDSEKDLLDPLSTPELPNQDIKTTFSFETSKTQSNHKNRFRNLFSNIMFFTVLFLTGVAGSMVLNRFISSPGDTQDNSQIPQNQTNVIDISPTPITVVSNVYEIMDKSGNQTLAKISLPPDTLPPVCDGGQCGSKGTYLPGGTRLTITVTDDPQTAANLSKSNIVDVNGTAFETSESSVSGKLIRQFIGHFDGLTTGGYRFKQMRGIMTVINNSQILEINHFAPNGISTDWQSDEVLFDQIIDSLNFTNPN